MRKEMKKSLWIGCLLALPGLAGCVLTHPTDADAPVRTAYRSSLGPRPAPSADLPARPDQPLSLAQCVEAALANNPGIAQRRWDAESAAAERAGAAGRRWPTLSAAGGYRRHLDDQRLVGARKPGEPGAWSSDIFSADLLVSVPLFAGGRIVNEIRASELLSRAATNRLARTRNELVFNVSSAFYSILGQRRVIESLEFSRKALVEHRKRVGDLIAVQKAARVDLLRTQVRIADLDERLVREKNTLAVLGRLLANLMGLPHSSEGVAVQGALGLPPGETGWRRDMEKAFAQRNDYLAAQANVEAQARRVDAARAGHWPTASLDGTYGERWAAGDRARQPGADGAEDVGSIGVSVNLPLFQGGRTVAAVRRERARLASAREALRNLRLQIRLEVQTAALNVASGRERVAATATSIEQARESLRIEREKYALGKGSITDVLDAQSALLEAETSNARALADYNIAIAQYRLAVGGPS